MLERVYQNGKLIGTIETEDPPEQLVESVRVETLRRLCAAFGARDQGHLAIKVQDATVRAGALTDKRVSGATLTEDEEAEAAFLRQAQATYMALKAVGNAFEAMAVEGRLPEDFRSDARWKLQKQE